MVKNTQPHTPYICITVFEEKCLHIRTTEVWVPQNDTLPLNIEYAAALLSVPGSFLTKKQKFHREGTLKLKIFVVYGLDVSKQQGENKIK